MRSAFELSIVGSTGRQFAPFLRKHLIAARETIPRQRRHLREMSVALVGEAKMSALHRDFMSLDGPTDVLTFPIDVDERNRPLCGEVVVCVPHAKRTAAEHKIPLRLELLLYAIHGMLHLHGYDDRTARDYREMHRTEDQILSQLGLGPVFARGDSDAPRRSKDGRSRRSRR